MLIRMSAITSVAALAAGLLLSMPPAWYPQFADNPKPYPKVMIGFWLTSGRAQRRLSDNYPPDVISPLQRLRNGRLIQDCATLFIYASLSHFCMKLFLAAPASRLPFLSTAWL
jgi:hypothetical protein